MATLGASKCKSWLSTNPRSGSGGEGETTLIILKW